MSASIGVGMLVGMKDSTSAGFKSSLIIADAFGLASSVSVLVSAGFEFAPSTLVAGGRGEVAWVVRVSAATREAGTVGPGLAGVVISALVVVAVELVEGSWEAGPAAGAMVVETVGRAAEGTTIAASRVASRAARQGMARMAVVSETIDLIKLRASKSLETRRKYTDTR